MIEDFTAIRSHFLDNLAAVGIAEEQVVMDNRPMGDVDETRPWARFQIRPGQNRTAEIGGGRVTVTQIGQIILQVFAPKGSGATEAYEAAAAFSEMYRDWRATDPTGTVWAYWSNYRFVPADDFMQVNAEVYYESRRRRSR